MKKDKAPKVKKEKTGRTGRPVKLSKMLFEYLSKEKGQDTFDAYLRRQFGLMSKQGETQRLRTYYLIDTETELIAKRTLAEARGETIVLAVRRGQKRNWRAKKDEVITVRELA